MDEPQKVQRDEIVPDLPDEIGKEITSATAAPHQNHLLRRQRGRFRTMPPTMPASRNVIVNLVIMPKPTTAPSASHQRWSPDFSRRTVTQAASNHHS
jgi:hypothetical protein